MKLLALIVWLSGICVASSLFGTSTVATACTLGCNIGPPPDSCSGALACSSDAAETDAFGDAHGTAVAGIGALTVMTLADATLGGNAAATAEADFFDQLTVTGVGVAKFTMGWSSDAKCHAGTNGGNTNLSRSLTVNGVALASTSCAPTVMSTTISVTAGQTIFINGQLSDGAVSEIDGGESDSSDPLRVFIQPLTPGDGYKAASGVVYPTAPIPEPASLLFLSTGLIAVGISTRLLRECNKQSHQRL